mmetsp:Transcript_25426/g.85039  ORF Transcript_25426/g.85039 Transcript_25426/m.85039 type:complete len:244 (+) Transcript_25426:860-1591(+)
MDRDFVEIRDELSLVIDVLGQLSDLLPECRIAIGLLELAQQIFGGLLRQPFAGLVVDVHNFYLVADQWRPRSGLQRRRLGAPLLAEECVLHSALQHPLLRGLVPVCECLYFLALGLGVLLNPVAVRPADGDAVNRDEATLDLRQAAQALQGTRLPKPGLVVLVVNHHCHVRSLQGLVPVAQLDRSLSQVLQQGYVQLISCLVLFHVGVRSSNLVQDLVALPPTGDGILDIALAPLHHPVLLAL